MALVKCKECKQEVSSFASKYPYCGGKNPGMTWQRMAVGYLSLGILLSLATTYFPGGLASKPNDESTIAVAAQSSDDVRAKQGSVADSFVTHASAFTITRERNLSAANRNKAQVFIVINHPSSREQVIGTAVAAIKDLQRKSLCIVCGVIVESYPRSALDAEFIASVDSWAAAASGHVERHVVQAS